MVYGGVNVFHVCLNFGIVYGVGVCVNVCGVVVRLSVWSIPGLFHKSDGIMVVG